MKSQYAQWIAANVTETYGKCAEITETMMAVFPELQRIRGHYYCLIWGERTHWWLIDPDGEIIDPTADQFPTKGHGEYVPWIEGSPEPTGRCLNCGEETYEGKDFCNDTCYKLVMADLFS